jgi:hypothetical protein
VVVGIRGVMLLSVEKKSDEEAKKKRKNKNWRKKWFL